MNLTAFQNFACAAISYACFLSLTTSTRADALDNWTTTQVSTDSFRLNSVVYGDGRYVAVGGESDVGVIVTSEDGLNWVLRAEGVPPWSLNRLAYGGGRYVAVGRFGSTAMSTNGMNWTYGRLNTFGLSGIAYGAGKFVAVGVPGTISTSTSTTNSIFYSTDGMSWHGAFRYPEEWRVVLDLAYGGGRFVAVAEGDYVYTSADGIVWLRSSFPGGNRIIYLKDRFFVPFGAGTNLVSSDGVSWLALSTGFPGSFVQMGYASGVFVALVGSFGIYTNVVTSTNGFDWVERAVKPFYSGVTIASSGFEIISDGRRFLSIASTTGSTSEVYNAYASISDQIVGLALGSASSPQPILSGVVGRSYRVEYLPALPASATNPWQTLTNLILPSSPYLLADPEAFNSMHRFYRAVLLP